jgi:hypothetical protein
MSRPIKWSGIDEPENHDLCIKRKIGYFDVMHFDHGWILYGPTLTEGAHFTGDRFKLEMGHVTRTEARLRAEKWIRAAEG